MAERALDAEIENSRFLLQRALASRFVPNGRIFNRTVLE
jgi:hypothetical protein